MKKTLLSLVQFAIIGAAMAQPSLVKDIRSGTSASIQSQSRPNIFGALGKAFVLANDGTSGEEFWVSDGTANGTMLLKDIITTSGLHGNLVEWNGAAYFLVRQGSFSSGSTELWKTDGTTNGTVKLKDLGFIPDFSTGTTGNIWPSGNVLYFYGADATNGAELWKTDGTANGTQMVADYSKGTDNSGLSEGFGINGKLIYGADSASNGGGLYVSDGNTVEVVNPAIFQDRPQFFAQLGSKAYFAMDEMIVESDGTVSGTKYLYDIGTDDTVISMLSQPVVMNNKMYFMGGMNLKSGSTVLKDELYVSDGTKAGTKLVYDHDSRGIEHMVTNGGKLFYTANTTTAGNELWISDGTASGTKMWKDLRPGLAKGFKGPMLAVGNYVLFQADGGPNGNELWQYDLNNSIGVITGDINPGSSSSNPQDFAEAGGKLFFRATAPNIGSELFVYTPIFIADTSTSGVTPPAAPSGLVASMGATSSDGNITVTWTDNSSDETAFLLETSADGSTNWTFVDSVGADVKTYDHVGLTAASVHYYRVKASKSGTHSAYSNVDSAMASTKDSSGTNPGSGINELDNSHSFKIYPNPANSSITLSREANGKGDIQIFNAIGIEVKKQPWKEDNNSLSLDISELPKGMYILTYSTSTEQTSLRLVKE